MARPRKITWLHLSDLHVKADRIDASQSLWDALWRDVEERIENDGLQPDFVAVTGDIASEGKQDEYGLAQTFFFDPLLSTTKLEKDRLFVVPGNHDVDPDQLGQSDPQIDQSESDQRSVVDAILADPTQRKAVLRRLQGYGTFVNEYFEGTLEFDDEQYFYVRRFDLAGQELAVLGLNSAWLSTWRDENGMGPVIGLRQVQAALDQADGADVKIALVHHALDRLRDFEQDSSIRTLTDNCDFILHGHLQESGPDTPEPPKSRAIILPSGACYPKPSRPKMYNWVQLDVTEGTGVATIRQYSDGSWTRDTTTFANAPDGLYTFEWPPIRRKAEELAAALFDPSLEARKEALYELHELSASSTHIEGVLRDTFAKRESELAPVRELMAPRTVRAEVREWLEPLLPPVRYWLAGVDPDQHDWDRAFDDGQVEWTEDVEVEDEAGASISQSAYGDPRSLFQKQKRCIHLTRPGDIVLAYSSSADAQLIGLGHIGYEPYERQDVPTVRIEMDLRFDEGIPFDELGKILPDLQTETDRVFFSVTRNQWQAIRDLVISHNPRLEHDLPAVSTPADYRIAIEETRLDRVFEVGSRVSASIHLRNKGNVTWRKGERLEILRSWRLYRNRGEATKSTGYTYRSTHHRDQTNGRWNIWVKWLEKDIHPDGTVSYEIDVTLDSHAKAGKYGLYWWAWGLDWEEQVEPTKPRDVVIVTTEQDPDKQDQLIGHEDTVNSATFDPKGRYIVTASEDGTARIWLASDLEQELRILPTHEKAVNSATFSPDGKRILTAGSDGTARIWDPRSGEEQAVIPASDEPALSGAFSPDGERIVTASEDGTARVWDAASGKEEKRLTGHEGFVLDAAFSPDGKRIVTACEDGTARIWDVTSGDFLSILTGHAAPIDCAVFSPDGTQIATASRDGTARTWDASNGQEKLRLSEHSAWVNSVAFDLIGDRIVTASDDQTACIWDADNGQALRRYSGHTGFVSNATFRPDLDQIVTAGEDGTARIWNIDDGEEIPEGEKVPAAEVKIELRKYKGHKETVNSAAFNPSGLRVVTAGEDGTARVWVTHSSRQIRELLKLPEHKVPVRSAAFSPDGERIVAASSDGTVAVLDAHSDQAARQLSGHEESVNSATFSPDGTRIVTASDDQTARIWDATDGNELRSLAEHLGPVLFAIFSPDGERIVTAGQDGSVGIWDATAGEDPSILTGHKGPVRYAIFSPDGTQIATASEDKTACIWDVAKPNKRFMTFSGHNKTVNSVAFNPDGDRIVTASDDKTVFIWDAKSGDQLGKLLGDASFASAAYSPDGNYIVTAGKDGKARLWDAEAAEQVWREETARALAAEIDAGTEEETTSDARAEEVLGEEETLKAEAPTEEDAPPDTAVEEPVKTEMGLETEAEAPTEEDAPPDSAVAEPVKTEMGLETEAEAPTEGDAPLDSAVAEPAKEVIAPEAEVEAEELAKVQAPPEAVIEEPLGEEKEPTEQVQLRLDAAVPERVQVGRSF